MATLSYSVTEPALRSPIEEWQPHGKQSESTTEWWYLTAVVHDTAGNPYFLVWCPFHFTGEKSSPASAGLRVTKGQSPLYSASRITATTSVSVISRQQW
jgi:predicted secreted hydrolase